MRSLLPLLPYLRTDLRGLGPFPSDPSHRSESVQQSSRESETCLPSLSYQGTQSRMGKHWKRKEKRGKSQLRISRDGRGETRLSDAHKTRILELAEIVPRDHLLLGLQLERGWRIGSIVGCHNRVTYTRKRMGEKAVCIVNLPGIRKEDVGHETIMIHFKGGKTEPDYPGRKWHKHSKKVCETRWCSELGSASQSPSTGLFRDILGQKNRQGLLESPEPYGT